MNTVECYCGNVIIAEGETVKCVECGRRWWATVTDSRVNMGV